MEGTFWESNGDYARLVRPRTGLAPPGSSRGRLRRLPDGGRLDSEKYLWALPERIWWDGDAIVDDQAQADKDKGGHEEGEEPVRAAGGEAQVEFVEEDGNPQVYLRLYVGSAGPYKDVVASGLRWLIENQDADGDLRIDLF